MFAKDILENAIKAKDVEEAVLKECGNISARAVGAEKSTPRLTQAESKSRASSFLALPG